jgi:hypothetical protein
MEPSVDTLGYSEEELEQIAGGSAVDTLGYSEEELAQIAGEKPQDSGPWFEAGPVRIEKSPLDVDWVAAAKDKWNQPNPNTNPLLAEAAAGPIAAGLSKVGSMALGGLERAATSPLPKAVADATNVTGKVKSFAANALKVLPEMSPGTQKIADFISGAAGRNAAYSNPVTAVPQAISDSARVVQGGQKSLAWILDHTPEVLGKAGSALKTIAAQTPGGLSTADFIMSQTNPEYQSKKRKVFSE